MTDKATREELADVLGDDDKGGLRATLDDAFDDADAAAVAAEGTDDAKPEGEEAEADSSVAAESDQEGEEAAAKAPEAAAPEGAGETDEAADEAASAAAATIEATGAVEAPAAFSAEDKAEFAKLTRPMQEATARREAEREADYQTKVTEIAPLREAVEPWGPYLKQLGVDAGTAFNAMIGAEHALRTGTPEQKMAALTKLATDYGIPLPADAGAHPDADDLDEDPIVERHIKPMQDTLNQVQTTLNSRERADAEAQQQQSLHTLKTFIDAKTEAGAPAHPHYADVEDDMVQLARLERSRGRTPDLKALYDAAIWSNPDVREKLLQERQAAATKADTAARRQKTKEAKKAGASVTGSPTGARAAAPASLRGTLEAAYDGRL